MCLPWLAAQTRDLELPQTERQRQIWMDGSTGSPFLFLPNNAFTAHPSLLLTGDHNFPMVEIQASSSCRVHQRRAYVGLHINQACLQLVHTYRVPGKMILLYDQQANLYTFFLSFFCTSCRFIVRGNKISWCDIVPFIIFISMIERHLLSCIDSMHGQGYIQGGARQSQYHMGDVGVWYKPT